MPTVPKTDVLYVKFKPDSVMTVSRSRFDVLTAHFGQDATFVTHFALSRLYDDVQRGALNSAMDIPIGDRAPTHEEWGLLRERSNKALAGRAFTPTKTLDQAWGVVA